jgi:serine/threonine protein kinase
MMRDGDIFLIDFGLSTYYMNGDGEHLERSDEENVIGSPRYISFYNHCGEPFSRRDDLISLGYMYMYLSTGTLPWDGVPRQDPPKISKTSTLHPMNISRRSLKTWTNLKRVVDGHIKRYLKYCYGLEFDEDPDYSALMELFT